MRRFPGLFPRLFATTLAVAAVWSLPGVATAQETGTVTGRVTRQSDGSPLPSITVSVAGTGISTVTGTDGRYTLQRVPAGPQTVAVRQLGYRGAEQTVAVVPGASVTLDITVDVQPVTLAEVVVSGASRVPERVVEAPAAITLVSPGTLRDMSVTGQAPLALSRIPSVDVVQSGIYDFNVNTRGFNSSLNRRILVLQDGRDLAIAFLGSQEWSAFGTALENTGRVEMVRGPGSALYGANAFTGVLNIITPPARDVAGTKITLAGGELETFRGDLRHAGVFGEGRFGYLISGGYNQSDTWSRSRTLLDGTSLRGEYAGATDSVVPLGGELRPLNGEGKDPATGAPTGDRRNLQQIYGVGRFDYYAPGGAILTMDGGATRSTNEVFVTGIGRVQVLESLRPWARTAWAAPRYNVMAWYSGRNSLEPQYSLAAGIPLEESSAIFHAEAQYNRDFAGDRARVVVGASARNYQLDTQTTLMAPENDDRSDNYFAGYAQVEVKIVPQVRLVAAARVDKGDLFEAQFSPRGAIVVSPSPDHSIRFTVNRAFQTPNYSEFFLRAPAGAPANFSLLEAGLRASPLGPALAGVPNGQLFTTSSAVPVLALGNGGLDVEHITALELGYKGQFTNRVFVSVDGYWNRLTDFVTDLLPAVNPDFGAWTSPEQVPQAFRGALEQAVRDQLVAAGQALAAAGLTRLANGATAIVVSYANAGKVNEWGIEFGLDVNVTDEWQLSGGYTFFDFDVKQQQLGDVLLPNTPKHKATATVAYRGRQGFDASAAIRVVDGFPWAAGVFSGYIPARQTVDASAGYAVNNNLRVHVTATNVLDQRRFQIFGGSVIGRRVIGGVTATF